MVGFTFTETWNTSSELDAELTYEPQVSFAVSYLYTFAYIMYMRHCVESRRIKIHFEFWMVPYLRVSYNCKWVYRIVFEIFV